MRMTHYDTQLSLALRVLLKRGLVSRTIKMAERDRADLIGFRRLAAKLGLNTRGMDRLATQLMAKPDLVGVAWHGTERLSAASPGLSAMSKPGGTAGASSLRPG